MPYLMLVVGLLIGLYALYRFFLNANVAQIKALFLVMVFTVLGIALFALAITGRLPAAIAVVAAILPIALSMIKARMDQRPQPPEGESGGPMTRKDALEVLDLEEGASVEEIRAAYKKLMQKVHPDNEGSDWMAAKLNQARDILLKDKTYNE